MLSISWILWLYRRLSGKELEATFEKALIIS
jgi:hypothetical protein